MNTRHLFDDGRDTDPAETTPGHEGSHRGHSRGHGGHGLMMLVMCLPMLVLAGFLVLGGAGGAGVVVPALVCVAMMAAMMFMMPGGHDRK